MEVLIQLKRILLVLLMTTVVATKETIVHNKFKKLETGKNIKGTIASELTTRSKLQCSDRLVELTIRSKLQCSDRLVELTTRSKLQCSDRLVELTRGSKLQYSDRWVELTGRSKLLRQLSRTHCKT